VIDDYADSNVERHLISYIWRRFPLAVLLTATAQLVVGLSTIAVVLLLLRHVQSPSNDIGMPTWGAVALAGIVMLVSRAVSTILMARLSAVTIQSVRVGVIDRLLQTPLDRFESIEKAQIDAALLHDAPAVSAGVVRVGSLLVSVAVVLAGLAYILYSTLFGASILLAAAGAILPLYVLLKRRTNRVAQAISTARAELLSRLSLSRSTMPLLKQNPAWRSHFRAMILDDALGLIASLIKAQAMLSALRAAVGQGGLIVAIVAVLVLVGHGHAEAAKATLLIWYMAGPIETIASGQAVLAEGASALQRIDRLIGTLPAEQIRATPPDCSIATVEYTDITYKYLGSAGYSTFELQPVNLTIVAGASVFVVGGNGSGKTTLLKVLTGLYAPTSGRISVNGRTLDPQEFAGLRGRFGLVPEDSLLHLAPSLPRAHPWFASLSEVLGLGAIVQSQILNLERLSTGERKRLALLYCLLSNADIYVFDEWAANQDPEYRDIFYGELIPGLLKAGKAVVAATHDDRYFERADHVVRLSRGNHMSVEAEAMEA
jgi:putative ATP-binding cassette transporter